MKDSQGGYIKIFRKIEDSAIWNEKPFDRLHAWMWLLLHANYADSEILYKGKTVTIRRGQLVTSYDKLAEAWGWSRNKVIRFTTWLTTEGMIAKNGHANGTTITIEKWAFYQDQRHTNETADGTADGTAGGTQKKKNKKNKKNNPTRVRAREGGGVFSEEDLDDPRVAAWERRKAEERAKRQKGGQR